MLSWPALLLAPLVALSQLSIAYSLVTPSCARQDHGALHAVAAVSLLVVVVMTAMAGYAWQRRATATARAQDGSEGSELRSVTMADSDGAAERPRFIELIAVLAGGLSMLVCIALWLPIWFLSPCS